MPSFKDLTNKRVSRLLVIRRYPENNKFGQVQWECLCDCGNITIVGTSQLRPNRTTSCGCFQKEAARNASLTHGMSSSAEYRTWNKIRERCYNERDKRYSDYGGRGITMCEEWRNSFEAFYRDMGPRPTPEHTIDRRENDKGYSKENCRWATWNEQQNNKRNNLHYEHKGEVKTLGTWCRELNLNYKLTYKRIYKYGWTFEEAITPIESMEVNYDGVTKTLHDWCDFFDLSPNHVYLRILRGEKFEKIVTE